MAVTVKVVDRPEPDLAAMPHSKSVLRCSPYMCGSDVNDGGRSDVSGRLDGRDSGDIGAFWWQKSGGLFSGRFRCTRAAGVGHQSPWLVHGRLHP